MKKVLLATSALALTAGVAHAEITFSGKAEAGIYRSAPTAATTGTAGRLTVAQARATVAAGTSGAAITAVAANDIVGFDATGALVIVKNTNATNAGPAANAAVAAAAPTACNHGPCVFERYAVLRTANDDGFRPVSGANGGE